MSLSPSRRPISPPQPARRPALNMSASCILVLFLAALTLAILPACSSDEAPANRSGPAPEVHTISAWTGDIDLIVRSVGQIRPLESVTLTSEVAGLVRAIRFDEGRPVKAGDLLVELDDTRARAELDSARAVRDRAERQLDRFERAATTAAASITELDTVRTDLALAEAQFELAQIRVADHRIIAPFDGSVGLRLVSTGAYIQPGTSLTTLTSVDPVDVEFAVPELYLANLRPGLAVTARAQAYQHEFPATVHAITPEVDPSTRTALVLARAPNPDGHLRPGMFVNVRLVLGQRANAVLVPEAALQFRGTQVSLFVVEENQARSRRVQVGERRGPIVEILEGVQPGDQVVISGLQRIRDGAAVRPIQQSQPLAATQNSTPATSPAPESPDRPGSGSGGGVGGVGGGG